MYPRASRTGAKALVTTLQVAAALAGLSAGAARAYETDARAHDPSTVVKSGGTYWVYSTGRGISQFSSKDRVHWTFQGSVFPTAPAWVAGVVPGNTRNSAWAPDIRFFGGLWHLYYCYSMFGRKISAIGTATNRTLDPRGWVDGGVVVRSGDDTDYNAIDPAIFQDTADGAWLSFGSFFSGIKLIRLDPTTGRQATGDGTVYTLAEHPQGRYNSIEASAVVAHGGYYYLFVNWDRCCDGAKSTYNIRMGRSKSVTGPYLDRDGKDMRTGGGTLFLGSVADDGSGRVPDDQVGPGHFGLLHDADADWFSFHEEWARDRGATTLNLQKLSWDADGWPRAVLDPGPYILAPRLAAPPLASVAKDAVGGGMHLQTGPAGSGSAQRWILKSQGNGDYSLIEDVSHQALTAASGSKVNIAPFTGRTGQVWSVRQNDDGTYCLRPQGIGAVALTVTGSTPGDGSSISLAPTKGLPSQEWSFHRP